MKPPSRSYRIVRWRDGRRDASEDPVTVEEPLEIRVNGEAVAVTMRTPGNDDELAAGFCLTEGIVSEADEIVSVDFCSDAEEDNVVDVHIERTAADGDESDAARALERARRSSFLSSSCGICGKQTLDRIEQLVHPFAPRSGTLSMQLLTKLPARMRRRQTVFSRTGGLHSAALFAGDGKLMALREDVGRHNAVDKVIGQGLLTRARRNDGSDQSILMVSGRASFEIVQKAAVAGIPVVAAISAPSSLAIDLAERLHMTLVGFLRGPRLNVYCGAKRIADG